MNPEELVNDRYDVLTANDRENEICIMRMEQALWNLK